MSEAKNNSNNQSKSNPPPEPEQPNLQLKTSSHNSPPKKPKSSPLETIELSENVKTPDKVKKR